jgi:hypothetical protein
MEAIRRKRQILGSNGNVYNLPTSYSIVLPFSCCQNGAASNGQSFGGCKTSINNKNRIGQFCFLL